LENFADRLAQAVLEKRTALVVGLDPRADRLPEQYRKQIAEADDPGEACAEAFGGFCRDIIDAAADVCVGIKPQMAFFEMLGSRGVAAYESVIEYAREKNLLIICDAKRSDIGSTCEAYAAAHLSGLELDGKILHTANADCLTVNPYLGIDGIEPFLKACRAHGKGLFVLVKTSNPSSGEFQDLRVAGVPLYECVASHVSKWGADLVGECGYSSVGAVVGATYPKQLSELRKLMPHAIFLVPGLGAQGGTAQDVVGAFDENGLGAVVNASRAVIFAYEREPFKSKFGQAAWKEAVREAACEINEQLRKVISFGKKNLEKQI